MLGWFAIAAGYRGLLYANGLGGLILMAKPVSSPKADDRSTSRIKSFFAKNERSF